jgi:extradiol dioxygenase family protein
MQAPRLRLRLKTFLPDKTMTNFTPTEGLLDNTIVTTGRYIAHVAVPCRDLQETARWYSDVLGAQPMRILHDRVTFSFGGTLQLVCHLERRAIDPSPRAYPRHFGLTFLQMEDFDRIRNHVEKLGVKLLVPVAARFANTDHEHQTFMLVDPSGNVVEFKCYVKPEFSY